MNNDPCKGCAVYKEIGCTHVDGFLCDFPTCDILVKYLDSKESPPENKENCRWSCTGCDSCGSKGNSWF